MVLDLRGFCTLNIGGVTYSNAISVDTTEDPLPGNGLIKSSGQAILVNQTTRPNLGDPLTISYSISDPTDSNIIVHPRKYFVTGSSIQDNGRSLLVTFADKLFIDSNLTEVTERIDQEDVDDTDIGDGVVLKPIKWKTIFNRCLDKLGITASYVGGNPFDKFDCNFSIEEFDFGAGYVQIMSDLLVSVHRIGYMNQNNVLVVEELNNQSTQIAVVTPNDLVEVTGLNNNGEIPATKVVVEYSYRQLVETENNPGEIDTPDEISDIVLLSGYCNTKTTKGSKKVISVENRDRRGRRFTTSWNTYPFSRSIECYDKYQRLAFSVNIVQKKMAEFMQGNYAQIASGCNPNSPSAIKAHGDQTVQETNLRIPEYKKNGSNDVNDPDFTFVEREVAYELKSIAALLNQLDIRNAQAEKSLPLNIFTFYDRRAVTSKKVIKTFKREIKKNFFFRPLTQYSPNPNSSFEVSSTSVNVEYLDTTTQVYGFPGDTKEAQKQSREQSYSGYNPALIKAQFFGTTEPTGANLVLIDETFEEAITVQTDDLRDQTAEQTSPDGDPSNNYATPLKAEIEVIEGAQAPGQAARILTLNMPFAPDDKFYKSGDAYRVKKSKAPQLAKEFGYTQLKLLRGTREGLTLFGDPTSFPTRPGSKVVVAMNGFMATFITAGLQLSITDKGVIGSLDCIYYSAIGTTSNDPLQGLFPFVSLPPGVTFPVAPPIVQYNPNIIGSIADVNAE